MARMTKAEIAEYVKKTFARYTEDSNETHFDIFHLYDTGKQCGRDNSGYIDARHMNVTGYNTKTMKKINLGRHDAMSFFDGARVDMVRIFADGSTLVRLDTPQRLADTQNMHVGLNPAN